MLKIRKMFKIYIDLPICACAHEGLKTKLAIISKLHFYFRLLQLKYNNIEKSFVRTLHHIYSITFYILWIHSCAIFHIRAFPNHYFASNENFIIRPNNDWNMLQNKWNTTNTRHCNFVIIVYVCECKHLWCN